MGTKTDARIRKVMKKRLRATEMQFYRKNAENTMN